LRRSRIPIDNNQAERGLRGVVVGRKNHDGSRSRRGTEVAVLPRSRTTSCTDRFCATAYTARSDGIRRYHDLEDDMTEWAVELKDVKKVYRTGPIEVPALRGISLRVAPGEFLAIAGPSGSGKTTLLNIIGGLDRAESGEVLVEGKNLQLLSSGDLARLRLQRLGFVFQAYNLLPVLTALENAEFTLLLQGVHVEQRKERVQKLFSEIGLAGLEHRRPGELSGGQQQRVAVARAMVTGPALILADEPTANLDSVTATALLEVMEQLNRAHGTTFVYATHDPQVMERARRLISLRDGQIVSDVALADAAP